jgi:hypothetical protein
MSDPDPDISNGPSNDTVEERTWTWFFEAMSLRFGPAYYQLLSAATGDHWPDVIALRAHDRVGFEITSPLRPEDVVRKRSEAVEDDGEQPAQARLEKRVIEALRRKIKKYGNGPSAMPLALLITLAHPSSLKFTAHLDRPRLAGVVRGHLTNFLHQPIDAVYLVGPGAQAHLLWRRRGAKWKKLFPELNGA